MRRPVAYIARPPGNASLRRSRMIPINAARRRCREAGRAPSSASFKEPSHADNCRRPHASLAAYPHPAGVQRCRVQQQPINSKPILGWPCAAPHHCRQSSAWMGDSAQHRRRRCCADRRARAAVCHDASKPAALGPSRPAGGLGTGQIAAGTGRRAEARLIAPTHGRLSQRNAADHGSALSPGALSTVAPPSRRVSNPGLSALAS